MGTLWQDLRYGLRMLLRSPGFTLIAVAALALGIGANTAIFSVVNAVLLRPLPFAEPDRLVTIWENNPLQGRDQFSVSYPNFLDWREQNRVFEQMAAIRFAGLTLTGGDEPVQAPAALVTADLFHLLRVKPLSGRAFLPEEDRPGGNQVVLISHRLWQRRFSANPDLIGKTITISGFPNPQFTVVGIMPPDFQVPEESTELWLPLGPLTNQARMRNRAVHINIVIARLKPRVTLAEARTEMEAIAGRIQQQHPGADPGHGVKLVPSHEQMVKHVQMGLLVLLGAVAFVLLIACANIANLSLARAVRRQKELAIRTALGASRWRVARQLLTESLLLALAGGAAGLLLALWVVDLFAAYAPDFVPRAKEISIDPQVLGFTLAISLLTGLIFGLAPALQASKLNLNEALKEGSSQSTGGPGRRRLRNLLVVSEVALSLVLLIGAGLMIKSFWRLTQVDPGFQPNNLLTLSVALPDSYRETHQVIAFFRQLRERLEALPGVQSASAVSTLPISGGDGNGDLTIEGRAFPPGETPAASFRRILPNYFRAIGTRLLRGREFDERDQGQDPKVVIINESMARRFWPNDDPIGKRIKVGPPEGEPWLTVVGVVGDVKNVGLDVGPLLATYEPHAQRPWSRMNLVVRTAGDPLSLAATVRSEVRSAEKETVISTPNTMNERISASVAPQRFNMLLLAIFAGLALVLATIGIYGVMSYAVTERRHEIGIRLALGAQTGDVLRLVTGQGMMLAAAGVAIGVAAALALAKLMTSFSDLLFGIEATDPATFVLIALLLLGVALIACLIPARRAMKVDPMVALRYE